MSRSLFDSASTDRSPQRWRRAAGLGALALVVIAAAGFAYLRSNNTPRTVGVPSANPLAVGLNPVRYAFVTPSLGWAVINPFIPSSSVGQFRVFRTVDGAKHWELQLTGQSSSPGFTPITVHFFDTTHGYMAVALAFIGDQVYRTTDGGAGWQAVQLPAPQTVVVTFSDPTHAWAAAQADTPSGQLFKLYATSDGATHPRMRVAAGSGMSFLRRRVERGTPPVLEPPCDCFPRSARLQRRRAA